MTSEESLVVVIGELTGDRDSSWLGHDISLWSVRKGSWIWAVSDILGHGGGGPDWSLRAAVVWLGASWWHDDEGWRLDWSGRSGRWALDGGVHWLGVGAWAVCLCQ